LWYIDGGDYNVGLLVVNFTFADVFHKDYPHVKQVAVSNLMRARQNIFPSTSLLSVSPSPAQKRCWFRLPSPAPRRTTEILRVVVRELMSLDLLVRLISDTQYVTEQFRTWIDWSSD